MAAPPGAIEARRNGNRIGLPEQGKGQRGARCSPPRNCGFRLATRRVGVVPGHNSISDVTGLGPVVPVNNAGSRTVLGKLDPEPVDAVAWLVLGARAHAKRHRPREVVSGGAPRR